MRRPWAGRSVPLVAAAASALVCLPLGSRVVPPALAWQPAQSDPSPMMNHAPAWSRRDNLILFDSDRGGVPAVYLIDPDRETVRRVSDAQTPACCAQWSPEWTHVVFEIRRHGKPVTVQVPVEGGPARPVTGRGPESTAADGAALVLDEAGGRSVVTLIDAGGSRVPLTRGTWASQPSFSPNGLMIVYEDRNSDDVGASTIMVVNRDGSERRMVARGTDPSWSPDGSRILFKTPAGESGGFGWQLATVRPDGSSLTRLVPGVHPSWSPDGRRIAFMAETSATRTDIWVITSDGTDRRCLTCAH